MNLSPMPETHQECQVRLEDGSVLAATPTIRDNQRIWIVAGTPKLVSGHVVAWRAAIADEWSPCSA